MGTIIKFPEEIELMRQAGRIVATILERLKREIKPGIKTGYLDFIMNQELERWGVLSAFKGYHGFPAHLCVSVNEEIVHGIPGKRRLKSGDVVSLDVGIIFRGFIADAAITVPVGEISPKVKELIATTEMALEAGIKAARSGARLGDVSAAIQSCVESRSYSVIREYAGHGIGGQLHEEPQVPNFGFPGEGILLEKGMTLAIEPMVSAGDWRTRLADNGWTVLTTDGSISAHFEHTIAITDTAPEILTIL